MTIEEIITEVQTALGVDVDGKAGPDTWAAIHKRIVLPAAVGTGAVGMATLVATVALDPRSEEIIATLLPQVRPYARSLVNKATANGIQIKVISGFRTYDEQSALFAKGRTTDGDIVTNAKAGYSNHNFGIAFDIGVFEGTRYLPESPKYKAVGVLGAELGLEWGGNWETIVDQPHFQLRPTWAATQNESEMLAALRQRVAADEPIYT